MPKFDLLCHTHYEQYILCLCTLAQKQTIYRRHQVLDTRDVRFAVAGVYEMSDKEPISLVVHASKVVDASAT